MKIAGYTTEKKISTVVIGVWKALWKTCHKYHRLLMTRPIGDGLNAFSIRDISDAVEKDMKVI